MGNKKTKYEIISTIIIFICSTLVLVLSLLSLFKVISVNVAMTIITPTLGVTVLLNAISFYRIQKKLGIGLFVCAGFILVCSVIITIMQLV